MRTLIGFGSGNRVMKNSTAHYSELPEDKAYYLSGQKINFDENQKNEKNDDGHKQSEKW